MKTPTAARDMRGGPKERLDPSWSPSPMPGAAPGRPLIVLDGNGPGIGTSVVVPTVGGCRGNPWSSSSVRTGVTR
jgi:hypothetical protein